MPISHSIRSYIGCALLLLFAYTSSAVLLKRSIAGEIKPQFNEEISSLEKKFEGVEAYLPSRGIIGYIDDDENILKNVEAARTFILTQYILAPLIVVRDTDKKIILGNFHDSATGMKIAGKNDLICIEDFGNGLMLLEKRAERQ